VQEYRDKNHPSQPVRDDEAGCDRDSVEKGVNRQAEQDGEAFVRGHKLIVMSFFSKMEMGCDGVLEEVKEFLLQNGNGV